MPDFNSDFRYVISTDLKLNLASKQSLIQDIKAMDTEINNVLNKTKEFSLPELTVKKIGLAPDARKSIQQEIGRIDATIVVNLRPNQSDIRAIQNTIQRIMNDSARKSIQRPATPRNAGNEREGMRRVGSSGSPINSNEAVQARINNWNSQARDRELRALERQQRMSGIPTAREMAKMQSEAYAYDQKLQQMKREQERKTRELENQQRLQKRKEELFNKNTPQPKSNISAHDQYQTQYNKMIDEVNKKKQELENLRNQLKSPSYNSANRVSRFDTINSISKMQEELRKIEYKKEYFRNKYQKEIDALNTSKYSDELYRISQSPYTPHHENLKKELDYRNRVKRYNESLKSKEYTRSQVARGATRVGNMTVYDLEKSLSNPSVPMAQKKENINKLLEHNRKMAMAYGDNFTKSFTISNLNSDGTVSRLRTVTKEFTKFGEVIDRSNRGFAKLMRNMASNVFVYGAVYTGFYKITQIIASSISKMAQFQEQMAKIQNLTKDFHPTGINSSGYRPGMSQFTQSRVQKDVFGLASQYGQDLTTEIMPLYQSILSRPDLIQKNGQASPDLAKKIASQVLNIGLITKGFGMNYADMQQIEQDLATVYTNTQESYGSGPKQVKAIGQYTDFLTRMSHYGVNPENVLNTVGEIAPNAIKRGLSIKDLSAMAGAYNLHNQDATSQEMTNTIKTFLGALAHPDNPETMKAFKLLGIQGKANEPLGQLIRDIFNSYGKQGDNTKSEIAKELASLTGRGKANQSKVQSLLDSGYQELNKVSPRDSFFSRMFQNTQGDAQATAKDMLGTLTASLGKLNATLSETAVEFGKLGVTNGIQNLIDAFNTLLKAMNGVLGVANNIGNFTQNMTGGAFNITSFMTSVLGMYGGFKLGKFAFNKFAPESIRKAFSRNLLSDAVPATIFSRAATSAEQTAMTIGNVRSRRVFNVHGSENIDANRRYRLRRYEAPRNVGHSVGGLLGNIIGSIFSPGLFTFGNKKAMQTGEKIGGNAVKKVGNLFKNLAGPLTEFLGILRKFSLVGAAITAAGAVTAIAFHYYQKAKQDQLNAEFKTFNKRTNSPESTQKLINEVNAETGLTKQVGHTKGTRVGGNIYMPETTASDATVKKNQKIASDLAKAGINLRMYRGQEQIRILDRQTGKQTDWMNLKGSNWEQRLKRHGLNSDEFSNLQFNMSQLNLDKYKEKMVEVDQATKDYQVTVDKLAASQAKANIQFVGAEGSLGYLKNQLSGAGQNLKALTDYKNQLQDRSSSFGTVSGQVNSELNRSKKNLSRYLSKNEINSIKDQFVIAQGAGQVDDLLKQFEVDPNKKPTDPKKLKDYYKKQAEYQYISDLNTSKEFIDNQKQLQDTIEKTNLQIYQQEAAMKQLKAQIALAATGINSLDEAMKSVSANVQNKQTLVDIIDQNANPSLKISRTGDLIKAMALQASGFKQELTAIDSAMANIKSNNPNQDFSLNGLYNATNGISSQQIEYKNLLEKRREILGSLDSSVSSLSQEKQTLKDLILSTDKYASMWEQVKSQISEASKFAQNLKDIGTNASVANDVAKLQQIVMGKSFDQYGYQSSQYSKQADQYLNIYKQADFIIKTYGKNADKLNEAMNELNSTLGDQFKNNVLDPMKSIIQNDFGKAGDRILNGASSIQSAASMLEQAISGLNTGGGNGGGSGSGGSGGGYNLSNIKFHGYLSNNGALNMSDNQVLNAYRDQNGFSQQTLMQMVRQMERQGESYDEIISMMRDSISQGSKNPAGEPTHTGKNDVNAGALDGYLRGMYKGHANAFIKAGNKFNIDPRLLASIAIAENGGSSDILSHTNNVGSLRASGSSNAYWGGSSYKGFRKYGSLQDGLYDLARLLRTYYFDEGYNTISKIQSKYAPGGGVNSYWARNVAAEYSKMTGIPVSQLLGGGSISVTSGNAVKSSNNSSSSSPTVYVVRSGDTLSEIGSKYGVDWHKIASANGISNPRSLRIGTRLTIPGTGGGGGGGATGSGALSGLSGIQSKSQWVAKHYTSGRWYYSSGYGPRTGVGIGNFHDGVDISIPGSGDLGSPAYAFLGGKVARKGYQKGGAGNYIVINDGNGYETKYMHLEYPTSLKIGQKVSAGDVLGKIGGTGDATAPHLHFGIYKNGKAVNPEPIIAALAAGKFTTTSSSSSEQKQYKNALKQAQSTKDNAMSQYLQDIANKIITDALGIGGNLPNNILDATNTGLLRGSLGYYVGQNKFNAIDTARQQIVSSREQINNSIDSMTTERNALAVKARSITDKATFNQYKKMVDALDSMIASLQKTGDQINKLSDQLAKEAQKNPEVNPIVASQMIRTGFSKIRKDGAGSVQWIQDMQEISKMLSDYMTIDNQVNLAQGVFDKTGFGGKQLEMLKAKQSKNNTNVLFTQLISINEALKKFAAGTNEWATTLKDSLDVQKKINQIEQDKLQTAKDSFDLNGNSLDQYVNLRAHQQSKDYNRARTNLNEALGLLSGKNLGEGAFGLRTGTMRSKKHAENVARLLHENFGVGSAKVVKQPDGYGPWRVVTAKIFNEESAKKMISAMKESKAMKIKNAGITGGTPTHPIDRNEMLSLYQIIAEAQSKMTQQMDDYRTAVTGAFEAGAMSVKKYISELSNLRDIQVENKQAAVQMVSTLQSTFKNSFSTALSNAMQGGTDAQSNFLDNIKTGIAQSVSSQLANVVIGQSGLNKLVNGFIGNITQAATSGNPNDIANMFKNSNFKDQLQKVLNPLLPLIQQIANSTNGMFTIMKNETFNAPQGFKIDSYLYKLAKGKSFKEVSQWIGSNVRNEAGSPMGGGSTGKISIPKGTPPAGVPTNTTQPSHPVQKTGTPTQTQQPSKGSSTPTQDKTIHHPSQTKVTPPKPKPKPKPPSHHSSGGSHPTSYRIKKGDTLSEIAQRYLGGASKWREIMKWNPGLNPRALQIGDVIKLYPSGGSSSHHHASSAHVKHVKTWLNMRSSPGYGHNVIEVLKPHQKVDYLGTVKGWAKIRADGHTGYVGPSYLYHTGGIVGKGNFSSGKGLKANEVRSIMQVSETALQPPQVGDLIKHVAFGTMNSMSRGGFGSSNKLEVHIKVDGNGHVNEELIHDTVRNAMKEHLPMLMKERRFDSLQFTGRSYNG